MINLTTAPHKLPKREYAHDEEAGMVPEQPVFDFEIITCHQSRFAPASNALPCFWNPAKRLGSGKRRRQHTLTSSSSDSLALKPEILSPPRGQAHLYGPRGTDVGWFRLQGQACNLQPEAQVCLDEAPCFSGFEDVMFAL